MSLTMQQKITYVARGSRVDATQADLIDRHMPVDAASEREALKLARQWALPNENITIVGRYYY